MSAFPSSTVPVTVTGQVPKAAAFPSNVRSCCPVNVDTPSPFFTSHLSTTISPNFRICWLINSSNSFNSIFTSVLLTCERVINFSIPSPMTISWSEPSGIMDISRFPQYVPITSGAVITASSSGGFSLFLLSLSSSSLLQAAKKVREQTNANKYNRFFFIRLWFSYYNKFRPL